MEAEGSGLDGAGIEGALLSFEGSPKWLRRL